MTGTRLTFLCSCHILVFLYVITERLCHIGKWGWQLPVFPVLVLRAPRFAGASNSPPARAPAWSCAQYRALLSRTGNTVTVIKHGHQVDGTSVQTGTAPPLQQEAGSGTVPPRGPSAGKCRGSAAWKLTILSVSGGTLPAGTRSPLLTRRSRVPAAAW